VPIYIPPLRNRKEDIPMLIDYFLEEYNFKLGKNILGFDDKTMDIMINYNWAGNVRELKNIIERICIFQEEEVISVNDLPKDLIEESNIINNDFSPLEISEQKTILNTLDENNWNISKSAEILKISRSTLRRKMEKYGLEE
jgi:transcriptional regulator with PAS, ATPase and Fis domain